MTRFCPLIQTECMGINCAWAMRDGDCALTMLGYIQDRLEEINNVLRFAGCM